MSSQASRAQYSLSVDETEVRALYRQLLSAWNRRSADAITELFAEDSDVIGFDGSELKGREEIASAHRKMFEDNSTGAFVAKVTNVRFLDPGVAVLRAAVGIVMPGQSDLDPNRTSDQRLVAVKRDGHWRAVALQNTPAQFHGRPEEARALTEELRRLL